MDPRPDHRPRSPRRRWAAAAATVLLALAATIAVAGRDGTSSDLRAGRDDAVVRPTSTTAAVTAPATTAAPEPGTASTAIPPTSPPATVAPTTAAPACRNSVDPACGPLRWEPPPEPQPLTVRVSVSPADPRAGAPVTFHLVVDDPDGDELLYRSGENVDFGDGTPAVGNYTHVDCGPAFGPWSTPVPRPIHEELAVEHVYAQPGTYTATFTIATLGNCAYPPDRETAVVEVAVGPA